MSSRQIRKYDDFAGAVVDDVGCGYHAVFSQTIVDKVSLSYFVGIKLSESLKTSGKVKAIEGQLPDVLSSSPDDSVD